MANIPFPRVAHNSCTGLYIQAWQKACPNENLTTAKQRLIGIVSIVAIPILSAIDAVICLTICATVVPLIYYGPGPLIDLAASIFSIVLSVIGFINICGIKACPPVGFRHFITGGPNQDVRQLESNLAPHVLSTTFERQLKWEGNLKGLIDLIIPLNLGAIKICNILEWMAPQKFELSPTEIYKIVKQAQEENFNAESEERILQAFIRLGTTPKDLLHEALNSLPMLDAVLSQPGIISATGEVCKYDLPKELLKDTNKQFLEDVKNSNKSQSSIIEHLEKNQLALDESLSSFLCRVISGSNYRFLELFLKHGASTNSISVAGRDLLTCLVMNKERRDEDDFMKLLLLLEYGAPLDNRWQGYTFFQWADFMFQNPYFPTINRIIELKFNSFLNGFKDTATLEQVVNSAKTAIREQDSYPNILKRLIPALQKGLKPLPRKERIAQARELIQMAIELGRTNCVDILLENGLGIDSLSYEENGEVDKATTTLSVYRPFESQKFFVANAMILGLEASRGPMNPGTQRVLNAYRGFLLQKQEVAQNAQTPKYSIYSLSILLNSPKPETKDEHSKSRVLTVAKKHFYAYQERFLLAANTGLPFELDTIIFEYWTPVIE